MAEAPHGNNKKRVTPTQPARPGQASEFGAPRTFTKPAAGDSQFEATELELPSGPSAYKKSNTDLVTSREPAVHSSTDFQTHKQAMQRSVFRQMQTASSALGLLSKGEIIDDWGGRNHSPYFKFIDRS